VKREALRVKGKALRVKSEEVKREEGQCGSLPFTLHPFTLHPLPFTLAACRKAARHIAFFVMTFALLGEAALARGVESHAGLLAIHVSGGPVLRNGQIVTLTWDALPRDTDEFELLLQCEAPVSIRLRLTECEEPEMRSFAWRVPDLPVLEARIVLRRGEKGRELLWARSGPLQIIGGEDFAEPVGAIRAAAANGPRVLLRDGELWLQENPLTRGLDEGAEGRAGEEISGRQEAALVPCAMPTLAGAATGTVQKMERERSPARRSSARPISRKPQVLQLRI